jgi:tRNA threonylcarbamoyladenosine biosynthesis protein TsaB
MFLLSVETTSPQGSLSIAEIASGVCLPKAKSKISWDKKASHSEIITQKLEEALQEASLSLDDVTHFAVDVGPGSFTGIRVGLNLVRTLAYASQKNARPFSSLEVLAFQNLDLGESAVVAIPAIQDFFYAATYRRESTHIHQLSLPESLDDAGLKSLSSRTKAPILHPSDLPRAETLAEMIAQDSTESHFLPWKRLLPLYIRPSEAEEKLRKGLLKPLI